MKKILLSITCIVAGILSVASQTLYAPALEGETFSGTTIIKFVSAANDLTVVTSFDGSFNAGDLVRATDGKLYGVANFGGLYGHGVIFSFDPSTLTYKKLIDFDNANEGWKVGGLVQAKDGKLYGMIAGYDNEHTWFIFSFDPFTSTYTKLKDFDGASGKIPTGSLIQASDGKLYGITHDGGSHGVGVIFSFDPVSSTYEALKYFDSDNGAYPIGGLVQALNGKLYGITTEGGSNGEGVIFSFDPATSILKKQKDFVSRASGGLLQASDGKLYGTQDGIFSFDPSSSKFTRLTGYFHSDVHLMQASDGKLYGMSDVIFSFDPATSKFTELTGFAGSGALPYSAAFVEVNDSVAAIPPKISITTPANNATYLAGGNVYLKVAASDADGTISKVEFYNDSTLLYTAIDTPYTFKWQKINKGNYTLTAKATDNSGLVTTSAPVNISVVLNQPPSVRIISPLNGQTFVTPANIHFEAVAQDIDGRVTTVEFYNGSTLLTLERIIPYTYNGVNVPAGTHNITVRATDNWGAVTISAPVIVTVTSGASFVSSRPSALNSKIEKDDALSLKLAPNPAKNIVNIYTTGLQKNKQATLSVISATGVIMKTVRLAGSAQTIPLNVSSLVSGVYTIKLMSGDKVMYRKFVKM